MVLRRCRRLLGDEAEALDAMQDVFVRVLKNADRLDDHAPSALLFRIATNVSLNRIRSRQRHPEVPQGEQIWEIATESDLAEQSSARQWLDTLFSKQPENTRLIAVLHWIDGYTYQEVAEIVGMSVSGVRKRLRNLSRLAQRWQAHEQITEVPHLVRKTSADGARDVRPAPASTQEKDHV